MKQVKVIIDTDPGVDDTHALAYVLNDPHFDIKLLCSSHGNVETETVTRNLCHIVDMFGKDIPVVRGYNQRLSGSTEDATFLHADGGLGGYIPPKEIKTKPLDMDAADAIYEVLKKYPHEITFCVLGPHTNLAMLLKKHPDAKDLIKNVLMMGGAPKGIAANPNHNSFNIRTDTIAFQETLNSKLQVVMVPSSIGRDGAYLTEEQISRMENMNDVGKFLVKCFETYWEPNYTDRRIATNDISAIYYLVFPRYYKTRRAFITVDLQTGKTTAQYTRKGNFKIAESINRKKFINFLFKELEEMKNIDLSQYLKQNKKVHMMNWEDETSNKKQTKTTSKTASKKSSSKTQQANKKTSSTNSKKATSKSSAANKQNKND